MLARLGPHAEVGADGSFRVTTFRTGDGAPAGRCVLTLTWPLPPRPGKEEGGRIGSGAATRISAGRCGVQVVAGENMVEPATNSVLTLIAPQAIC
jgi:hypothetical protein